MHTLTGNDRPMESLENRKLIEQIRTENLGKSEKGDILTIKATIRYVFLYLDVFIYTLIYIMSDTIINSNTTRIYLNDNPVL
jgi:hypothetical protein